MPTATACPCDLGDSGAVPHSDLPGAGKCHIRPSGPKAAATPGNALTRSGAGSHETGDDLFPT